MYLKECSRCKHTKQGYDFMRNSKSKDGLGTRCKACARETRKDTELQKLRKRWPESSVFNGH